MPPASSESRTRRCRVPGLLTVRRRRHHPVARPTCSARRAHVRRVRGRELPRVEHPAARRDGRLAGLGHRCGGPTHTRFLEQSEIAWRHTVASRTAFLTVENLNSVIGDAGFRGDVDLVSIDVDGVDYWLLRALSGREPQDPDRRVQQPLRTGRVRHCAVRALASIGWTPTSRRCTSAHRSVRSRMLPPPRATPSWAATAPAPMRSLFAVMCSATSSNSPRPRWSARDADAPGARRGGGADVSVGPTRAAAPHR